MNTKEELNPKRTARIAGLLYMLLIPLGVFGMLYVPNTLFVPDFGITFSEFTFLGELLITLWLLIKGVNVEEWKKRALKSSR